MTEDGLDLFSRLKGLDLFTGIGGISLALQPWVRPIAYCEKDRYAQSVLLSRISVGDLENAPIWDDVTTLSKEEVDTEAIDIIYGGFPCTNLSTAGDGKGLAGKQSGLFFEVVRLVEEVQPSFIFLENVPAIRTRGLNEVVRSFTNLRYDCRWTCVSASAIGAPHDRKRWFLLAHSSSKSIWEQSNRQSQCKGEFRDHGKEISLANSNEYGCNEGGLSRREKEELTQHGLSGEYGGGDKGWEIEPSICRVVNGVSNRVDRLKTLGNSVVARQVRIAFKKLMGIDYVTEN